MMMTVMIVDEYDYNASNNAGHCDYPIIPINHKQKILIFCYKKRNVLKTNIYTSFFVTLFFKNIFFSFEEKVIFKKSLSFFHLPTAWTTKSKGTLAATFYSFTFNTRI